jgi:hypothetical protein
MGRRRRAQDREAEKVLDGMPREGLNIWQKQRDVAKRKGYACRQEASTGKRKPKAARKRTAKPTGGIHER